MVEKRNNLATVLIWTAFGVAVIALIAVAFLCFELHRVTNQRDDAVDLGNRIAVGQTVAIKSALAGLATEDILFEYCSPRKKGDPLCDKFAVFLGGRAAREMYEYQPADALYWPVTEFLSKARESDKDLADGWNNQDQTVWDNGVAIRKDLPGFLLAIPDAQRTGAPTPTPRPGSN